MVTNLSTMLIKGEIDDNSTVHIDCNSNGLTYKVIKNGGVAAMQALGKGAPRDLIELPPEDVKRAKLEDPDWMDEEGDLD